MKLLINLIIILLISSIITNVNSIPTISGLTYNSTTIVYEFPITSDYFSKWILYNDINYPSYSPLINFNITFDCSVVIGSTRYCSYNSPDNFKKFSASPNSRYCTISAAGEVLPCGDTYPSQNYIFDHFTTFYPKPFGVTIGKPSTAGGNVYITGYLNRFLSFPGVMSSYPYTTLPSDSGNFVHYNQTIPVTDPLFDCNNFAVIMPPGTGRHILYTNAYNYITRPAMAFQYQYASPVINSFNYNSVTSKLTLIGNNFGTNKALVVLTIDDVVIPQSNFNINVAHTSIEIINYSRVIGFSFVKLEVDLIQMDINQYKLGCVKPIITSYTTVPRGTGGVITLTGSFPSSNTYSSVKVGTMNCPFVSYSQTTITCTLPSSTTVEINALPITFTITSGSDTCVNDINVSFLYAPTILPVGGTGNIILKYYVTLIGSNFGTIGETVVNITPDGSDIVPTSISADQTQLVFKLNSYQCRYNWIYTYVKRTNSSQLSPMVSNTFPFYSGCIF